MRTVDRTIIRASPQIVWPLAVEIERWPDILSHYRYVKRLSGVIGGAGTVEMSAWRPFEFFQWPTWWRSEMGTDPARHRITYRHVGGITTGMDVVWTIHPTPEGWSDVTIVHEWGGPPWPLIGAASAAWVIGPVFVHGIASRTLAGIADAAVGRGPSAARRRVRTDD